MTRGIILFLLLSFLHMTAECYGLTLRWDASPDQDVVGYKVYFGLSAGVYSYGIDVGHSMESTLCGFYEGRKHYAAVTAYNDLGRESNFSNEVSYTIDDGVSATYDNCPNSPNGRYLGSCVKEISGVLIGLHGKPTHFIMCKSNNDCEADEICQMAQEDFNDNGVGDACECYADINDDGKVNTGDLGILKMQFNLNGLVQADLNGDGKVNTGDLGIMKVEFMRSGCL